ncbi:MAG TPA: hypothetical protein VKX45_09790 [Bryobacteraceae bacterium]|jgi:tetratricopeptide (TPR) repeat protein|nr:hypothetical protein [Bryobacteraceae bacterium]
MKLPALLLLTAAALCAANEQQQALLLKAQSDYDRVAAAAAPTVREASACIQSQAALEPVAPAEELALVRFRKGYCTLAAAATTGEASDFRDAAADFEGAAAVWPARAAAMMRRKQPLEPIPSILRVLAQISRLNAEVAQTHGLHASEDTETALSTALNGDSASFLPPATAHLIVSLGRTWQAYLAFVRGDLAAAARDLPGDAPAWSAWVAGRQAFAAGRYAEAASNYQHAVADWDAAARRDPRPLFERLAPPADPGQAYADLGGAQLLAGDPEAAIASLNQAVKRSPTAARALFLRARAEEAAGRRDAALADYNLASRTAFANAKDLASGEAHLYRGILLYRRHDYAHAEDEFSSALNFEIAADLRSDAVAWRRLAAVASGSCETAPGYLQQALPTVSPYFPQQEARAALAACGALTAR